MRLNCNIKKCFKQKASSERWDMSSEENEKDIFLVSGNLCSIEGKCFTVFRFGSYHH